MSPESFYLLSRNAKIYSAFFIYGILTSIGLVSFIYTVSTPNRRNLNLIIITGLVIILGISCILYYSYTLHYYLTKISNFGVLAGLLGINISADNLLHWMICFIYLKVTIEVKSLLDKEIIMHNAV